MFYAAAIGVAYSRKKETIDLMPISQLTAYSFVLISIIYTLVAKTKSVVKPALIGLVLISISSFVVWMALNNSFISKQSLWYSLGMLIFVGFHYTIA